MSLLELAGSKDGSVYSFPSPCLLSNFVIFLADGLSFWIEFSMHKWTEYRVIYNLCVSFPLFLGFWLDKAKYFESLNFNTVRDLIITGVLNGGRVQ